MDVVYCVSHLTKVYRRGNVLANDDITLEVYAGEILGLLGPNGAGKTTLVKQLVGLLKPTSGAIRLLDHDIIAQPGLIPHIVAYFAQEPVALEDLTPREILYFTGRFRGLPNRKVQRQATQLLERLDLLEIQHTPMRHLSGGQKRLAGLAATLIGERPIMILDEPTNELDPDHRRLVWNLLRERNRSQRTTIILVTHNVLEAEQVVDRVGIIDHGRLLALDSVGALKKQVDQRLRIEILTRPGGRERASAFLGEFGEVQHISENRQRLFIDPDLVPHMVTRMLHEKEWLWIEDYRIMPPTLEDVYFLVGGKEADIAL